MSVIVSKNSLRNEFENPRKLPLNNLFLKVTTLKGTTEIKALDKHWVMDRAYPSYPLISSNRSRENVQDWIIKAENYLKALTYFKRMPYYIFWSHVTYEPAFTEFIDSFFEEAIPLYYPQYEEDINNIYLKIYNQVFVIYKRLFVFKHSETEYMLPETVGTILYDNSVIKIDNFWNVVRIYGQTNEGAVANILMTAFQIMPALLSDLRISLIGIQEIFECIGTTAYEKDDATSKEVTNLTFLLYDTAFTIHLFMELYPPFKNICISEDFFSKIIHVYESELPLLCHFIKTKLFDDEKQVFDNVENGKVELLEICNLMLSSCLDMILQRQNDVREQDKWIDIYLSLVLSNLSNTRFLVDFNKAFPISQQIEMLTVICPNIDQQKCNNILSSIPKTKSGEVPKPEENGLMDVAGSLNRLSLDDFALPENIVLDSKITEVLEIFPHLGDGFIEKCLLSLEMDAQRVIMSVLENTLPEHLATLDQSLPRIPAELPTPALDMAKGYRGKKPEQHTNINQLLNDKSHVRDQKERFTQYGLIDEDQLYDDDFDDSCTDRDVNILGRDDLLDLLPKNNNHRNVKSSDSEPEDVADEQNDAGPSDGSKANFCEDPAVLRARREAKYQQMRSSKNRDVVGKAKGQGQDKSVVINRDHKNKNKSSSSNHNRRSGAQWKRSRGMLPA